jgi:hypothetical protein
MLLHKHFEMPIFLPTIIVYDYSNNKKDAKSSFNRILEDFSCSSFHTFYWSSESRLKALRHAIYTKLHKMAGKIWQHAFGLHLKEFQWFADPSTSYAHLLAQVLVLASGTDQIRIPGCRTRYS